MAESIFYCGKCNKTFNGLKRYEYFCPDCGYKTIRTKYSVDKWRSITDAEKDECKNQFMAIYDKRSDIVQEQPKAQSENAIGAVITAIGLLTIIVGFCYIIILFVSRTATVIDVFRVFSVCFISGMMFIGFGEVINLLQKILDK